MTDLRAAAEQALNALRAVPTTLTAGEWLAAVTALSDALAAPVAPAVPAGWVMVPVEPTQAMCAAAVKFANGNAVYKKVAPEALKIEEAIYGEAYAAMLAAAPQPTPAEPTLSMSMFATRADYDAAIATKETT